MQNKTKWAACLLTRAAALWLPRSITPEDQEFTLHLVLIEKPWKEANEGKYLLFSYRSLGQKHMCIYSSLITHHTFFWLWTSTEKSVSRKWRQGKGSSVHPPTLLTIHLFILNHRFTCTEGHVHAADNASWASILYTLHCLRTSEYLDRTQGKGSMSGHSGDRSTNHCATKSLTK